MKTKTETARPRVRCGAGICRNFGTERCSHCSLILCGRCYRAHQKRANAAKTKQAILNPVASSDGQRAPR